MKSKDYDSFMYYLKSRPFKYFDFNEGDLVLIIKDDLFQLGIVYEITEVDSIKSTNTGWIEYYDFESPTLKIDIGESKNFKTKNSNEVFLIEKGAFKRKIKFSSWWE